MDDVSNMNFIEDIDSDKENTDVENDNNSDSSSKAENKPSKKAKVKVSATQDVTTKNNERKTLTIRRSLSVSSSSRTMNANLINPSIKRRRAKISDNHAAVSENNNVNSLTESESVKDALNRLKNEKELSDKKNENDQLLEKERREKIELQKQRKEDVEAIHKERIQNAKLEKERLQQQKAKELAEKKSAAESNKKDLSQKFASKVVDSAPVKDQNIFAGKNKNKADDEQDDINNKKKRLSLKQKGNKTRITVQDAWTQVKNNDYDDFYGRFSRKKNNKNKPKKTSNILHTIEISNSINIISLAHKLGIKSSEMLKSLKSKGFDVINAYQILDPETASLAVEELGHKAKLISPTTLEDEIMISDDESQMVTRPPIISIMGHVDHGKTSLLDALRNTNFVDGEEGGITQSISAYRLQMENGDITFLDTPGHAAFSSMRSRGANLTDIALLIVAADDGVKEQTIEAIGHAKLAKIPIIVVINKIDKPGANPSKVKAELMQHEIYTEDMGGETISVEVSAKNKTGLDKLLDAILLQASIMDLKAQSNRSACCKVVETNLVKGHGIVATVIVETGTLKIGDYFVVGKTYGKVRGLISDRGKNLTKASLSQPVIIFGFHSMPQASDSLTVVKNEQIAKNVAEYRNNRDIDDSKNMISDIVDFDKIMSANKKKELNIIIKADTRGACEAVKESLLAITHDEVAVRITKTEVGDINDSDVLFAESTNSIIAGFNIGISHAARKSIIDQNIEVLNYKIIYELILEIKDKLSSMLEPEIKFENIGELEVRKVFEISKIGRIAGCYVRDGLIKNTSILKIERNSKLIFEDKVKTLKRTTDEAQEIKKGLECGVLFEKFNDIQEGDIIKCFEKKVIKRSL